MTRERNETDHEFAQAISSQLRQCAGWEGDRISVDRKRALDYYFQRPRGDEVRGRSNVVAGDVSAMVEANLAQMLDSFTTDNIAEFAAMGPEDDDQAQLESFAVVQAVMRDNNGYQEIGTAVKDALLLRNGWLKSWTEETVQVETLDLENATTDTIAALREQPGLAVELLAFDADEQTARVRVTATQKQFKTEAVDPGDILYPKQWHRIDTQEIPIIAERHIEARSKLIERGFPKNKVSRLKKWQFDSKVDKLARDVGEEPSLAGSIDKSTDLIEWFEVYVQADSGDGTSERRRVAMGGVNAQSILENVPQSRVPYSTGSPFINAHRMTGISLFDKLKQTQDLNTGLQRALLDNVNTNNKNRTAYLDGKVNTDDLADGRPNGNVRVKASVGDVRAAMSAFSIPDMSNGILANLDYQRSIRTELGGASLEMASGQMQMAGGRIGSEGVDRAFSVMEQLASHMTKNLATSMVRNLFLNAHATLRENFDTPVSVKVNGRWQSPIPSEWQPRTAVVVKVGMSPGERARKVAALGQVVQAQFDLASNDMDDVLVNIEGFYRALTDWGRAAEIPNPEQYFLDPATDESKEALERKDKQNAQAAEANRALMSQAVGLEQLRAAFDKYRHDSELQFKYFAEVLGAEVEEAKIVGKATTDLVGQTKFGANGASKNDNDGKPDNETQPGSTD